jgi:parvulin-like peptidyl-prolyl isomerase
MLLSFCGVARAEIVNRVVAIVNDEVITEADVTSHVAALLEAQDAPPVTPDTVEMREVVLRRLIEQRLMLQEAKRAGVAVSSEEILERLEEMRGRFESEEQFRLSLKETGLSEELLKEKIREQLLVQHLIETQVRATITISPQEVARELAQHPELARPGDRVRALHLLIRVTPSRSEEQARALTEELRRRLTAGEAFADLARRYSEDPHRDAGGAMDWVGQGELLPELDAALFALSVGQVSEPIQTRLGFHLLRLEERRDASSLSPAQAHRNVSQQIFEEKLRQALARWVDGLKRDAYIEILREP